MSEGKALDPTRDEMLAFLKTYAFISECDDFDIEEAIYWYANDYHSGQWSNLYSVASTSEFRPGPFANGPEEGMGLELYAELENEYGKADS